MEKNYKYFFVFFLIFIIFFAFSTEIPKRHRGGFFSDEGAYFAIIQSLAFDYDLKYTREDFIRIKKKFSAGPMGLFLKKTEDGNLYYAKSFVYPLVAAPFYRLFEVKGLLLLNGLMLFLAVLMSFLLLRQHHSQKNSFRFSLIFILATITPIYLWWLQADLFNFFMIFTGLFFFFYRFEKSKWFYFSSLFFSLAVFSKPSNIIPVAIIFLILLFEKKWKQLVISVLIAVICLSCFLIFYYSQTGERLSYKLYMGGDRKTFHHRYPFEKPEYTFDNYQSSPKMSADNYWQRLSISPEIGIFNFFYYFFGRFTGMFIYFASAFFVLILFIFQKKEKTDWFILLAIGFSILFYILITSDNYFGGSGSVGNRYFLNIFPLFFFLGYKTRIFKFSFLPLGLSLIFLSGVYIDSFYHSSMARPAGLSFPIKLFPPEKTQFLSLPTNQNFRAFGRWIHDGNRKYQIFFINDNFWTIEENYFWTRGNKQLELFVVTLEKVKEFEVSLKNIPEINRVFFQVEYRKKELMLAPNQEHLIKFKNVSGLKVKNRYIYYLKIKSDKDFCYYFANPENEDKRILGIKSQIKLVY